MSEEEFARHPLHTGTIPFMPGMLKRVVPGSTDVGDVSYVVPTAWLNAACYAIGTPGHSWQLAAQVGTSVGEKGMLAAARAMAQAAVTVMEEPSLLEKAQE